MNKVIETIPKNGAGGTLAALEKAKTEAAGILERGPA